MRKFCLRSVVCAAVVALGAWMAEATPEPGLRQYRIASFSGSKYFTPENWQTMTNGAAPVVVPGALMAKNTNSFKSVTWKGVTYPWNNQSGYWYEGYMRLEAGKTYSAKSSFDDGGCVYIDGQMVYQQGSQSGYNGGSPSFTPQPFVCSKTGWYRLQLGMWDWGGGRGIYLGTFAIVQWSDGDPATVVQDYSDRTNWHEFWDADDDGEPAGTYLYTEIPPSIELSAKPTISYVDDEVRISATLAADSNPGTLYAIYGPSYPFAHTNVITISAVAGETYTYAIPDLAANASIGFGVIGEVADGLVTEYLGDGNFFNGTVSIAKGADASAEYLDVPGVFTVSRPSGATTGDMVVNYTVSGTAVAGTHYIALSGSVTIPDGENSATVEVLPLPCTTSDHTLTLTVASGLYQPSDSSATITIAKYDPSMGFANRVDFTLAGYSGAALADFPVLVKISEASVEGFRYADCKLPNGGDVRFATANGEHLSSDIDTWNTEGESLVWVKIPSLAPGTTITMLYGNGDPFDMVPSAVWSDAYLGVWHFGEIADGVTPDAAGNGLGMTAKKPDVQVVAADGQVGNALVNCTAAGGTNGGFLSPTYTDKFTSSKFTISAWFNRLGHAMNGYERFFSSKDAYNNKYGFEMENNNGSTTKNTMRGSDADTVALTTYDQSKAGWHKYTLVYNDAKLTAYVDGVATTTDAKVTKVLHKLGFSVGNNSARNECAFWGNIDEVRFAKSCESADWVAAEYAFETGTASFTNDGSSPVDATSVTFESTPVVTKVGDRFKLTAVTSASSGTGTVRANYGTDGDYGLSAVATTAAAASTEYTVAMTGLASDTSYKARVEGENAKGTIVRARADETFYNGNLAIAAGDDADEKAITTPGTIIVSRADTYGDLVINYATGGTAVGGTNYQTLPGSVTITNGATSAAIEVYPLKAKSGDHTLTITLADGLYFVNDSAKAATITIKTLVAPEGWNTWVADADGKASVAANWSDGVPKATDKILFDGRYSTANCEWDAEASATVAEWKQESDYTGTVTFDTTYDDTFPVFNVTGDVNLNGGYWTHPGAQDTATYRLKADIGGDLTVAASAGINCRFKGFKKNKCYSGGAIGIHGGSSSDYAKARDSVYFPSEIGAGGGVSDDASRGGGAVWLTVSGAVTLNGDIDVHSTENSNGWGGPGSGAPGSVYLSAKSVSGSGKIHAEAPVIDRRGTQCPTGGRVAIYLTEATTLGLPIANIPHYGALQYSSGAGTLFVKTANQQYGTLYISNTKKKVAVVCGVTYHQLTGTTPIVAGETWTFDKIVLENEGCLAVPAGTTLVLPNGFKSVEGNGLFCGILYQGGTIVCGDSDTKHTLQNNWVFQAQQPFTFDRGVIVKDGAAIGQMRFGSTKTNPSKCEVTVNGDLTVESSGYLWARGTSLVNSGNFESDFNGRPAGTYCYGGLVGIYAASLANANYTNETAVYGSIFNPSFPGTHGAGNDGNDQHMGGGYINLTVNGALTLDGHAYADGGSYGYETSGVKGSGGALNITAESLSGSGTIDADGTANSCTSEADILAKFFPVTSSNTRNIKTCSGGGRVAVKLTEGTFSDYWIANITAKGASRTNDGKTVPSTYAMSSAGTVFLGDAQNNGTIYIRNDGHSDNTLAVTPIPAATNRYAATDAAADFKKANLYIGDCGRILLSQSFRMRKLTLEADTSLDLNGQTLTVTKAKLGDAKLPAGVYTAESAAVAGYVTDSVGDGQLVIQPDGVLFIVR